MYKISDACVSCGACVGNCPVDAISAGDTIYEISDACVDCAACVDSCPVDAISAD
jgi:ferredoxin